jgi:acid phosphatase type 7
MNEQVVLAIGDACGPPDRNPSAVEVSERARQFLSTDPNAIVLLLGDNAYDRGAADEYTRHFTPLFGAEPFRGRTRACPGNHDYLTAGAAPYFATLGETAAGRPSQSFYSFDLPCGWHVISLNTEIEHDEDSAQVTWLRDDLAARTHGPLLAFWHRPRWGSGGHRDSRKPRWFWKELFAHRAELVLNGHAHHYERFAPQTPKQVADSRGIREFIVGTGGRKLGGRTKVTPNSEVMDFEHFGLLKLTLSPARYLWEFVTPTGATRDSGQNAVNH